MIKRWAGFCVLFVPLSLSAAATSIQIDKRVILSVSPPQGSFLERVNNPPIMILEGDQNEIIVWRGAFAEVFSEDGKLIRRVGGLGLGPGEFTLITRMNLDDNSYYILDISGQISVFSNRLDFLKRIYLRGEMNSNIIYDVDVAGDEFVTAQRWRQSSKRYSPKKDFVISVYNKEGLYSRSFFPQKEGWAKYPDEGLLGGNVLFYNNYVYWAFKPINKIWRLSLKGEIIAETTIGSRWWRDITLERKQKKRVIRRGGTARRYFEALWESGYIISDIARYQGKLLINISSEVDEEARTSIVILDPDLSNEIGPLSLVGYSFSGAGQKYLYFSRYLSEYSTKKQTEIEIVKCVLKK